MRRKKKIHLESEAEIEREIGVGERDVLCVRE